METSTCRLNAKRAADRARYAELRALGICPKCAVTDAEPGRSLCRPCLDAHYRSVKRRLDRARQSATRCTHCGSRRRVPGLLFCATCRRKNRDNCRNYQIGKRIGVAA